MSYNYIECSICGCKYKMLTRHFSSTHGLSKEDVELRYPDLQLVSDSYRERKSSYMSERNKENWKRPEYRSLMTNHWSHKLSDPEFQKKRDKARLESLRKDSYLIPMRLRVKKQYVDLNMGEKLLKGRMTPEGRKRRSESSSIIAKNNWSKPGFREMMRSIKRFGKVTEFQLSSGDIVKLRSKLEYLTYEYLLKYFDFSDINYEDILVNYVDAKGVSRTYHTDFYIPKYNIIIEVKPQKLWYDEVVQLKKDATISEGYQFTFSGYNEINDDSLYNIIIGKASKIQ